MTTDGNIAAIFGWPESALTRDRKRRVRVSWFPMDAKHCILLSGDNPASVDKFLPMSKALEEEYRAQGIPADFGAGQNNPYHRKAKK